MSLYKAPPGCKHDGTKEERDAWWAWYTSNQEARDKQSAQFANTAVFCLGSTLLLVPVMLAVHDLWQYFTK
jgi:hypothetical protein